MHHHCVGGCLCHTYATTKLVADARLHQQQLAVQRAMPGRCHQPRTMFQPGAMHASTSIGCSARAPAAGRDACAHVVQTEYYDAVTTVTMFLGSSRDYVDTYLAAAHGMRVGDPDAIVGGPGIAYNINTDRRHFPHGQRPNGGDMVIGAANHSQPVDFFSFHVVNPCMDQPGCNITEVGPAAPCIPLSEQSERAMSVGD